MPAAESPAKKDGASSTGVAVIALMSALLTTVLTKACDTYVEDRKANAELRKTELVTRAAANQIAQPKANPCYFAGIVYSEVPPHKGVANVQIWISTGLSKADPATNVYRPIYEFAAITAPTGSFRAPCPYPNSESLATVLPGMPPESKVATPYKYYKYSENLVIYVTEPKIDASYQSRPSRAPTN